MKGDYMLIAGDGELDRLLQEMHEGATEAPQAKAVDIKPKAAVDEGGRLARFKRSVCQLFESPIEAVFNKVIKQLNTKQLAEMGGEKEIKGIKSYLKLLRSGLPDIQEKKLKHL